MKKSTRHLLALTALLALSGTAVGCMDSNNSKSKTEIQQAFTKQAEMSSFSFAGAASLDLDSAPSSASSSANPIASGLAGMFTNGKLEWTGVTSTEPLRMDIDLKATPAGASTAMELPMIFKDNKLFLHIPLLNKNEEYFSIDLAELAALSKQSNSLSPEGLKKLTKLSSDVTGLALSEIPAKWFKKTEAVTLKDGSKGISIKMEITDKNKKELTEAVKKKLPEIADSLKANGVLKAEQADKLKQTGSSSFSLESPGVVSVAIDGSGFIREQQLQLQYTMLDGDGKEQKRKIDWNQSYNDINQPAKFTKEEPKQTRSLTDILKLLAPKK